MILEYLLLTLPLVVHSLVDLKGKVNHTLNAVYVTVIAVVVGFLLPGFWWQGAIYALSIHFCFFDPVYNLTHGKPLLYLGKTALTDRLWGMTPPTAQVFVRLWVLGVGAGFYYNLDKIISWS